MTDDIEPIPPSAVPHPRPGSDQLQQRQAVLDALARRAAPDKPRGAVEALTDQVLLCTSARTAKTLLPALPEQIGGLVLGGAEGRAGILKLRDDKFDKLLLADPEGYRIAPATEDKPFILPQDGLFPITLDQDLQTQRDIGADVAMTPTGYLHAGDSDALRAAVGEAGKIDRDDVLFSAPLDIAWFTDEHIAHLIAVLAQLPLPKAVFLGGQYDPVDRYKAVVVNLRRFVAEAGHVALFRTDLAGFDALSHGAFAASIGSGGSRRHMIPVGQTPYARTDDHAPSVLFGDLLSWHKGSTIAKRYGSTPAPACHCQPCSGRRLNTFLDRADQTAAHRHSMCTWADWIPDLLTQRTLRDRATWWRTRCASAVTHADIVNTQLNQPGAFATPAPVQAWSDLPAWLTADQPTTRRSKTR